MVVISRLSSENLAFLTKAPMIPIFKILALSLFEKRVNEALECHL